MIDARALATADPLGIGGLLTDAQRLGDRDPALRRAMIEAARTGLALGALDTGLPAAHRLAFRELGLAIGLQAEPIDDALRDELLGFWANPRAAEPGWREHEDINDVMLATALVPDGFLGLEGPKTGKPRECGAFNPRCHPDLNWGMTVLQTVALPLGDGTEWASFYHGSPRSGTVGTARHGWMIVSVSAPARAFTWWLLNVEPDLVAETVTLPAGRLIMYPMPSVSVMCMFELGKPPEL